MTPTRGGVRVPPSAPHTVRSMIILLALFIAAGCARYYWSRPGVTAEQFAKDSQECVRTASHTQGAATVGVIDEKIYRACLQSLGYTREKKFEPPEGWFRGIE
jgi:hypothetical protein